MRDVACYARATIRNTPTSCPRHPLHLVRWRLLPFLLIVALHLGQVIRFDVQVVGALISSDLALHSGWNSVATLARMVTIGVTVVEMYSLISLATTSNASETRVEAQ